MGVIRWSMMVAACVLPGCGQDRPSFFDDPTGALPDRLSALDLHPDRPPPPELRAYDPVWPLWSSGSDKARLMFLPGPIDTTAPQAWEFPIGTVLFKTFAYAHRPVETRVVRRLATRWSYDVYLWSDDGADADLLPLDTSVQVDLVDEGGHAIAHRVPNRLDCRTCHESAPHPVLGVSELQLDDDALAALDADGLRSAPSPAPARIRHDDPTTRDVLGLLHGNCVHCHNGTTGVSASFDLRHPVALANTVNQPTASSASAAGIRVVPRAPQDSILFLAFSGETSDPEVKTMPPLGIDRRDTAGIELVRRWITELP